MSSKKRKAGTQSPMPPSKKLVPNESDVETASLASAVVDGRTTRTFKNPDFKQKRDKTLKQILTAERAVNWGDGAVYTSIEAPPSLLPMPKYCDITGLPARYTDPRTKLRYHSAAEYEVIQDLPEDMVKALLALRKERHGVYLE